MKRCINCTIFCALWALVAAIPVWACEGFTQRSSAMAALPDVALGPETGNFGRPELRRNRVRYLAADNSLVVLERFGRCPYATDAPALCGLDRGGRAEPMPGEALKSWGVAYGADDFALTVRLESDVAAGLPGRSWRLPASAPRSGFVGYCASASNPIAELRISGRNVSLSHIKHEFDPRGRPVRLPANPTVAQRGEAVIVEGERGVRAIEAIVRANDEPRYLSARYAVPLGLPITASFNDVLRAVSGDGRYLRAFTTELAAYRQRLYAAADASVRTVRATVAATLARIGYQRTPFDPARALLAAEDPATLVTSSAVAIPLALDIGALPLLETMNLVCVVMPDHLELLELPVTVCEGSSTCEFPLPWDLVPRNIYFTFSFPNLSLSEVDAIVAQQQSYTFDLQLNGKTAHVGPPVGYFENPSATQGAWAFAHHTPSASCPSGTACMTVVLTTAGRAGAVAINEIGFPWELRVRIKKQSPLDPPQIIGIDGNGNPITVSTKQALFASKKVELLANAHGAQSYFEYAINPTYSSDRCKSCHAFETQLGLAQHPHHGNVQVDLIPSLFVEGGHVMTCANGSCHSIYAVHPLGESWHETQWRVPFQTLNVNWGEMDDTQRCVRTKENLPTVDQRRLHFHGDLRLHWAIDDAEAPFGTQLAPAFPFDFVDFLDRIDRWNYNGSPCPG